MRMDFSSSGSIFIRVFPGWWKTDKECRTTEFLEDWPGPEFIARNIMMNVANAGKSWDIMGILRGITLSMRMAWCLKWPTSFAGFKGLIGLIDPLEDLRLSNRSLSQSVHARPLSSALGDVEWRFRFRFHCWTRAKNLPTHLRGRSSKVWVGTKKTAGRCWKYVMFSWLAVRALTIIYPFLRFPVTKKNRGLLEAPTSFGLGMVWGQQISLGHCFNLLNRCFCLTVHILWQMQTCLPISCVFFLIQQ